MLAGHDVGSIVHKAAGMSKGTRTGNRGMQMNREGIELVKAIF